MDFITVNGQKTAYRFSGEGDETLVILQGWGTTMSVYDSVAAAVADRYRVLQFDLPGFGDSPEPPKAWDVEGYGRFFIALMEALQVERAVLLGHSNGGRIIIKLLSGPELPFQVSRAILVDSAGIVPEKSPEQLARIKRYKTMKRIADNKLVSALFGDAIEEWKSKQGSEDYRNASPIMRQTLVMAVNEDLRHLLPDIHREVLLIWGDGDTATPLGDGQLMESLLPDAGLAVIKGAGHYCFLDAPIIFRNILRSYLCP